MTGTRAEVTPPIASVERLPTRAARDAAPAPARPKPTARVASSSESAIEPAEFPLRNLSIRMDPKTHRVVAKVIDAKTGEVVRQVPPEELARLDRDLGPRPGRIVDSEA